MPSKPKIGVTFETLLELLSDVKFDAEVKPEISDELVSFDEVILWNYDGWWIRCQKMTYSVDL